MKWRPSHSHQVFCFGSCTSIHADPHFIARGSHATVEILTTSQLLNPSQLENFGEASPKQRGGLTMKRSKFSEE